MLLYVLNGGDESLRRYALRSFRHASLVESHPYTVNTDFSMPFSVSLNPAIISCIPFELEA